jgi:YesN/AraC family two-component response regulator
METNLLSKVSILLVEDDIEAIEPLKIILEKYVKKLYIEHNGENGLESFKTNRPDIVLTDIQMPSMNGIEMAESIREINHHTPIIYISGYSETSMILKAIDAGADGFLLKPILKQKLLNRLIKSTKVVISDKCIQSNVDFLGKFMEQCSEQ